MSVTGIPYSMPTVDEPRGNAFFILGECYSLMKQCKVSKDVWEAFHQEATKADYNNLRNTVKRYFDVQS